MTTGFTIEITSRHKIWWRYNVACTIGCFDAAGKRTGFASAASQIAEVGAQLRECPQGIDPQRKVWVTTADCESILGYIYIIPHTLPESRVIEESKPFEVEIRIAYNGKKLRSEKHKINQWGGASLEIRCNQKGEK